MPSNSEMTNEQRMRWLLRQILMDLPQKRDWLNPDYEAEAREWAKSNGEPAGCIPGIKFAVSNDGGKTGVAWRDNVFEALDYLAIQQNGYAVVAVAINNLQPEQSVLSSRVNWSFVAEDEVHGWFIQLESDGGNTSRYLLSDGTVSTFLPCAQPWLCWSSTKTEAEEVARRHGYAVSVSPLQS